MERKHKRNLLVLFVIGAIVILILINLTDLDKTIDALKSSNKGLLLLAVLLQFVIIGIVAFRWRYLLKKISERVSFKDLYILNMAGTFFNNITPGARIGGEAVKAYLLTTKFNVPIGKSSATVVVERIFDFLIFSLVAVFGYFYVVFVLDIPQNSRIVITVFMFLMICLCIIVIKALYSEDVARKVFKFLPKKFSTHFFESFSIFKKSSSSLIYNKDILAVLLFLTFFIWTFEILRPYLLFKSLNTPAPFFAIALVITVSLFLSMIPLLPGGIGIAEGTMLGLYLAIGIPMNISIIVTLLDRLISYWIMLIAGGIAASVEGIGGE